MAWTTAASTVVDVAAECARRAPSSVPRLRQLVVRFSDEELREIRAAAASAGLAVGAWAGESVVAAARAAMADAGFADRALLRRLIEGKAEGCAADDAAMGALVDELIDVLVARLS